jgi:hypothetical protein
MADGWRHAVTWIDNTEGLIAEKGGIELLHDALEHNLTSVAAVQSLAAALYNFSIHGWNIHTYTRPIHSPTRARFHHADCFNAPPSITIGHSDTKLLGFVHNPSCGRACPYVCFCGV